MRASEQGENLPTRDVLQQDVRPEHLLNLYRASNSPSLQSLSQLRVGPCWPASAWALKSPSFRATSSSRRACSSAVRRQPARLRHRPQRAGRALFSQVAQQLSRHLELEASLQLRGTQAACPSPPSPTACWSGPVQSSRPAACATSSSRRACSSAVGRRPAHLRHRPQRAGQALLSQVAQQLARHVVLEASLQLRGRQAAWPVHRRHRRIAEVLSVVEVAQLARDTWRKNRASDSLKNLH